MTTLTAFYDLSVGPVSFDFVVFLIKAEIERERIGATRMHVVIVPDPNGPGGFRDKSQFYDQHEARFRLWNILIPACRLFNASVTLPLDWQQAKRIASEKTWKSWPPDWDRQTLKNRWHLIGGVIAAARSGVAVPILSASEHARRKVREFYAGRKIITMTLRNTYLKERNSDREAWLAAKAHIERKGCTVMVLEDTNVALSKGSGYGEFNLDIRMACYQEAALNLQANNGAASLCWFSDRPWLMFDAGVGESAEEWRSLFVAQGLPLGATWPWSKPQQKIVYKQATAETIIAEFEESDSATS